MRKLIYLCVECGAECWHLLWQAMKLERAEAKCPKCGQWARFELRAEELERRAA